MIGLAAPTYDTSGAGIFREDSSTIDSSRELSRRVTRTATLDGGAVVADTGYSDADRTVTVSVPGASSEDFELMTRLVKYYNIITVSLRDGCFNGVPAKTWTDNGTAKMKILITERISG